MIQKTQNTKKIIVYMLVLTLVCSYIFPTVIGSKFVNLNDKIDQSQEDSDDSYPINGALSLAQTFKPNLAKLTRVVIQIEKDSGVGTRYKYFYLNIKKDDFYSAPLTSTYIEGSEFSSTAPIWYEFDFPDIKVDIGSTYIIHVYGFEAQSGGAPVKWRYAYDDPYGSGQAFYVDINGNFLPLNHDGKTCDFSFITYGREAKSKNILSLLTLLRQIIIEHLSLPTKLFNLY